MARDARRLQPRHAAVGADLISAVALGPRRSSWPAWHEALRAKAAAEGESRGLLGELKRETSETRGPPRLRPGRPSASGSRGRRRGPYPGGREVRGAAPPDGVALCAGEITLDKVRAVADVATAESDHELCEQAGPAVRQLVEVARTTAARAGSASVSSSRSEHDGATCASTMSSGPCRLQLPPRPMPRPRATLVARARAAPLTARGRLPWDQRLCDAFLGLIRSGTPLLEPGQRASPHLVVAHVAS